MNSFNSWIGRSFNSPEEILSEFKKRFAGIEPAEVGPAISFLPESVSIRDVPVDYPDWAGLPLAGVPFLVKDLYDVAGWPTKASSLFLADEYGIPDATSPLVRKFMELGATPVGKTHLNEFAYGLSGRNMHYGNCRHPHHPDRLPGGSSSGSAWAVGKGLVPLALGTDTGGSVRVPAAFCGLFGIRLIPNEWSQQGCFPLSPTFDTAGWFTADREDMATTLKLMLDLTDSKDTPRGVLLKVEDLPFDPELKSEYASLYDAFNLQSDPSIQDGFQAVAADLTRNYSVLQSLESYLVHEKWLDSYRDMYNPAVWQRIDRGRHWSSEEIVASEKGRGELRDFFGQLFQSFDYAVLPATMIPAPREDQLDEAFRSQIITLTAPASLAALPVLTVPVPLEHKLSGGLQIIYSDPESDLPLRFLDEWKGA